MRSWFPLSKQTSLSWAEYHLLIIVTGLLLGLTGCEKVPKPGVPVAQVNGTIITDYQVERQRQLTQGGNLTDGHADALQVLIERQLLQDEALRQHLDRDPYVIATIEHAKAEILAQALLQSRTAIISVPKRDEVEAYFYQHPEKFSKRTLFHLKEIVLSSKSLSGELHAALQQARSLEDMAAWLDGRRIQYVLERRTHSSAEIPEALLEKIKNLEPGQLFIVKEEGRAAGNASLCVIISTQESPLGLRAVAAQIQRSLLDDKTRQQSDVLIEKLRANAKVHYPNKNMLTPTVRTQTQRDVAASALVVGQSEVGSSFTH